MTFKVELWLATDEGERILKLSTALGVSATKVVSGVGWLDYTVPRSFDFSIMRPDRIILFLILPEGTLIPKLWNVYFARTFRRRITGGKRVVTFGGPDINSLLWRRIVAAKTGSAEAQKTSQEADDMMKDVVREALLDTADPIPEAGTRAWSRLTVQADSTSGPVVTKAFAFHDLLTPANGGVMPMIVNASITHGQEVFYWIEPNQVSTTGLTLEFRTYTEPPGGDVSDKITFDSTNGSLGNPDLLEDYSEEKNYIYAAGQEEGANRVTDQAYDTERFSQSIWARSEGFADARDQERLEGVTEAANAGLRAGQPRVKFTASLLDTESTRFGVDWDVGYVVHIKFETLELDSIVRAVSISVDGSGNPILDSRIEYNT